MLRGLLQGLLRGAYVLVELAIIAFFVVTALYSAYTIYDTNKIYKAADVANFQTYRPESRGRNLSFRELQAKNDDVIGWLKVYGTGIDYPLLYSNEFDAYINKDPEGKFSLAGSVFLDYKNAPDFGDFKTIIYGHHMEDGLMFGDLDKFRSKKFFRSRRYGKIYYGGKYHSLEIFAYFQGDAYDDAIYSVISGDRAAARSFLDLVRRKSHLVQGLGCHAERPYRPALDLRRRYERPLPLSSKDN